MTLAETFIDKHTTQWQEHGQTFRDWKEVNSVDDIDLREDSAHLINLMVPHELPWLLVFGDGSFLLSINEYNMFLTPAAAEIGQALTRVIATEYEYISEAEGALDDRQRLP